MNNYLGAACGYSAIPVHAIIYSDMSERYMWEGLLALDSPDTQGFSWQRISMNAIVQTIN